MEKTVFDKIQRKVDFSNLILNNIKSYCEKNNLMDLLNDDLNTYIKHYNCCNDLDFRGWLLDIDDIMVYVNEYIYFDIRKDSSNKYYIYLYNMEITHEIDEYNNLSINVIMVEDIKYL